MKFKYFINANKSIAIVISIEEYKRIKLLLKEFYTQKQIEYIDDYCKYKPLNDKFLLCNPYKVKQKNTPIMDLNAVTSIDMVPFKQIEFE